MPASISSKGETAGGPFKCDWPGCRNEAVFFVTWARDRRCTKREKLCDDHARITLTNYTPTHNVRAKPALVTQNAVECDIEYVAATTSYREQSIVLTDCESHKLLAVLTGYCEALALSQVIMNEHAGRPRTHDAAVLLVHRLGATIEQVSVDSLEAGIYHANVLMTQGAQKVTVDIRPSDAFVLALIADCPIMFNKQLVANAPKMWGK